MDQLLKAVKSTKLEKSPGRKMAIQVNIVTALWAAFKHVLALYSKKAGEGVPSIAKNAGIMAVELLQVCIY
jgi:hypothetical protein